LQSVNKQILADAPSVTVQLQTALSTGTGDRSGDRQ
jgi:hypothetical protein